MNRNAQCGQNTTAAPRKRTICCSAVYLWCAFYIRHAATLALWAIGSKFNPPILERWIMRYELTDQEWSAIKLMLPNKPRGVPRVNDRRILNGIYWVLRSGAPWRDLPSSFGP